MGRRTGSFLLRIGGPGRLDSLGIRRLLVVTARSQQKAQARECLLELPELAVQDPRPEVVDMVRNWRRTWWMMVTKVVSWTMRRRR